MAQPLEVNLGTHVRSSDGKSLGNVDQLIVDADTNTLAYLVIDKGKLHDGRLVDINLVASTDHDGVVLTPKGEPTISITWMADGDPQEFGFASLQHQLLRE